MEVLGGDLLLSVDDVVDALLVFLVDVSFVFFEIHQVSLVFNFHMVFVDDLQKLLHWRRVLSQAELEVEEPLGNVFGLSLEDEKPVA